MGLWHPAISDMSGCSVINQFTPLNIPRSIGRIVENGRTCSGSGPKP
jgi:hypothetical protein